MPCKDPEQRRAYERRRRLEKREHIDAVQAVYRQNNAERRRQVQAAYRAANLGQERAKDRARYARDRDARKAGVSAYIKANPEKHRAWGKVTDHKRRKAPGRVTAAEIREIMSHPCAYCGAHATHLEHCTPLSRGGWNQADNLVAACASCNLRKGTQTVLEFLGWWPRVGEG